MIFKPSIERILRNAKQVRELILIEFEEIRKQFSRKELYPEIDKILQARENINMILGDEFARHHGVLIFDKVRDIYKVDEMINLSSFYGDHHLYLIERMEQLKCVVEFTKWIGIQYDSLLQIGGPLATSITNDFSLSYGGPQINPMNGVLLLKYRDEYSYPKTKLYRYHHYHEKLNEGAYVHKVDLHTDLSLSLADSHYARGRRPPFRNGLNSLICMQTSVPANVEKTTSKIARHLLRHKLIRLCGHQVKTKN